MRIIAGDHFRSRDGGEVEAIDGIQGGALLGEREVLRLFEPVFVDFNLFRSSRCVLVFLFVTGVENEVVEC